MRGRDREQGRRGYVLDVPVLAVQCGRDVGRVHNEGENARRGPRNPRTGGLRFQKKYEFALPRMFGPGCGSGSKATYTLPFRV